MIKGDKRIPFDDKDIDYIKNFLKNGFTLIGFKDRDCLKDYHNKKEALFLIPDDEQVENSSETVDALI